MYRIIKIILLLLLFLFNNNTSYAASVDVWEDQSILLPTSDDLNLSATVVWFDLCDFVDYMWTEETNTLFIEMPYEKDMAMIYSNDLNDNPWTYTITLTATCNWWEPSDWGFIEEDSFILDLSSDVINNDPTDIILSNNIIDENVSAWTYIGNFTTIDPDDPSNLWDYNYSLVSWIWDEDNEYFYINDWSLYINISPDYETKSSYLIRIKTEDEEWWTFQKEFIININDLDETIPSIDAWIDQYVTIWDTVILNWIKTWFPTSWCEFNYNWFDDSERVSITNSWSLTWASFTTDSFTWSTTIKIDLSMIVTSSEIIYDSCWKTGRYFDDININISELSWDTSSKSYASKMREEANKVFLNPESIELHLYEINKANNEYYSLRWNNIWWDWQIEYELQYSTGSKFSNYYTYNTKSSFKSFTKYDLEESSIYFFRVKAKYDNKESSWSNTIFIVNKNNPLKDFKVICKNCGAKTNFQDVFDTVDLLIEDNLNTTCPSCNKKVNFWDIFIYKDVNSLVDDNFKINKNTCKKKINYKDILLNDDIFYSIKCSFSKEIINFDDLIK